MKKESNLPQNSDNTQNINISTIDLLSKIVEQEKIALDFGFYWKDHHQIMEQIRSECLEVEQAILEGEQRLLKEEMGDLITATISLCIFLKLDPQEILTNSISKFQRRFDTLVELVKQDEHENLLGQPLTVLLSYWERAKKFVNIDFS